MIEVYGNTENMIEVYGQDGCVYCEKAVSLLNERQMQYKYYKIGTDITGKEFKEMFPEAKTVPAIAIFGFYIGGYEALENYLEEISGGYGDSV
jgi:glutaredoxin